MKRYVLSTALIMSLLSQSLMAQDITAAKAKLDKQKSARTKAVAKIMNDCQIHTSKTDVENRHIAEEVITGMGGTCAPADAKPTANLESFMKDVDKSVRKLDQDVIWNETTKIALEKSVKALLALHMRVVEKDGQLSEAKARGIICGQIQYMCKKDRPEAAVITSTIKKFLERQKKTPIQFLDGSTQEKLRAEFNKSIEQANIACGVTLRDYRKIKSTFSCMTQDKTKKPITLKNGKKMYGLKTMNVLECDQQFFRSQPYLEQLKADTLKRTDLSKQLLITSGLGPLLAGEKFREKVGPMTHDYKSCSEGTAKKLKPVTFETINAGRTELYELALNELKRIQTSRIRGPVNIDVEKDIRKYLKTNPQTISELLKRTNDPLYAKSICYYIDGIHFRDKISNYIDTGLIAVGVISSVAFTFATGGLGVAVLAPATSYLAAVSIGSTGLALFKNYSDLNVQRNEDMRNRQAMVTEQRKLNSGVLALDASDAKKELLISNMKWSAAGLVLEGVGLGFARAKAVTVIDHLKENKALYEMVDGTSQSAKASNLHKGSQNFIKTVKGLKAEEVGMLKNLPTDQQAKLAAVFAKLDPVEAKLMVEKLSKLDEAKFKKFFLMLDDAKTYSLDQKTLKAALTDFSKTGKPTRLAPKLKAEELAKLGPSVPKDVSKVNSVYGRSSAAIKDIAPKIQPEEIQKILTNIRNKFRGMVSDEEIGFLIEKFASEGIANTDDLLKKFDSLSALKQKHPDFFQPNGIMNVAAFKDEGELTKLAYLDALETGGVPIRNAKGEILLAADGQTVLRKDISKLSPLRKVEALTSEMNAVARQTPCSLPN